MCSSSIIFAAVLGSATFLAGGSITYAQAAPTTQPTEVAIAPRSGPISVMVFPFRLEGNVAGRMWISQVISAHIRMELAVNSTIGLVASPAIVPASTTAAIEIGRRGGADYVVDGSCEIVNDQLVVTGSLIRLPEGKVVAPLRSAGDVGDLLPMESQLADEVQMMLPPPVTTGGAYPGAAGSPPENYYYPAQPPTPNDAYPYAGYDYYPAYPYYGYDYGWPYGGFEFFGGGYIGGRDFHGGHFGVGNRGGGFHGGGFQGGGFHGGGFGGGHGGGHR
jgi:TolB-like protein